MRATWPKWSHLNKRREKFSMTGVSHRASHRLTKLQQRFQQHVLVPQSDQLADMIAATPRVSRATRLRIYTEAYRLRLAGAMDSDYHQLHVFSGDEAYTSLMHAYIQAYPSRQPSLRRFGEHLPAFLRQTEPYCLHSELAELAEFEWALCHAFDAADAQVVSLEQLTAIAPEAFAALTLGFHPSLKVLSLHCAAPQVWEALNDKPEEAPPPFDWSLEARTWLVWRQELRMMFRPAEPDECWALNAFQGGQTFGDVCEGLCRWHAEDRVPQRAVALLQRWLSEQLVVAIATVNPGSCYTVNRVSRSRK
jgi:hypothetical protein